MHNISTLKNGLTLITISLPHLDSLTSLIAVGAGSRYEMKKVSGISHFLEHMFFKGSRKFPTAEQISTMVDSIGAIHNAGTSKEFTTYWIKSSAKHTGLVLDILSSMVSESLLAEEEIKREKGVIVEELRMYKDIPQRYVLDLYESLQFGDQPLGWDLGGDEETVNSITRNDLVSYMDSLYSPKNMTLVLAGKLPANLPKIIDQYFSSLPPRSYYKPKPYKKFKQSKPKISVYYKQTDQANVILGVEGFPRTDKRRYAARVLAAILGEGMSSRLFLQVRERRGLAYHIGADHTFYMDTGSFSVEAGLKLEALEEALEVIKAELERMIAEKVTEDELSKGKEMIRGRLAIRGESTNFLAEYFGVNFILDGKIETFKEYLENIDKVTREDLQEISKELFKKEKFNCQIIAPLKSADNLEEVLNR